MADFWLSLRCEPVTLRSMSILERSCFSSLKLFVWSSPHVLCSVYEHWRIAPGLPTVQNFLNFMHFFSFFFGKSGIIVRWCPTPHPRRVILDPPLMKSFSEEYLVPHLGHCKHHSLSRMHPSRCVDHVPLPPGDSLYQPLFFGLMISVKKANGYCDGKALVSDEQLLFQKIRTFRIQHIYPTVSATGYLIF